MTANSRLFTHALRDVAKPELVRQGFAFDGKRTFRRLGPNGSVAQLINFQLGQRSLQGRFTVNLGVFREGDASNIAPSEAMEFNCTPDNRVRLGLLLPASGLLARLPVIGDWFSFRDRWWSLSSDAGKLAPTLETVLADIRQHGFGWLEAAAHGTQAES